MTATEFSYITRIYGFKPHYYANVIAKTQLSMGEYSFLHMYMYLPKKLSICILFLHKLNMNREVLIGFVETNTNNAFSIVIHLIILFNIQYLL